MMIDLLRQAINELPKLMKDKSKWDSQDITFKESPLHRIYTYTDDYTLCLHKFNKYKTEKPFYHNHPWKFATMIVEGCYEAYVGTKHKPCGPFVFHPFSYYKSATNGEWHSVIPYEKTYTILVYSKNYAGLDWDFDSNNPDFFDRLNSRQFNDIWNVFKDKKLQKSMKESIKNPASKKETLYLFN